MFYTISRFTSVLFTICICLSPPIAAISADADNMMHGFNMMMERKKMMKK